MPFPARIVPTRQDIEDVYLENTTNILQKTSVSNMIGLLNQLNKISIFASEIFKDILDTTSKNGQRIKKVSSRLQSVSSSLDSAEQMFLVNSPAYFYDNPYTGKEWQRKDPLRGLLFRRDRSEAAVNRRRDVGLPLPDLSKLDRISMTGPCIKKFSDSNFFMNEWLEAEKKKMEEEKAKRRERKKKRKRKKREVKDKITGIERWVYDPITGKKVKKVAAQIKTAKYILSDDPNYDPNAANVEFDTSETAVNDRTTGISVVARIAQGKSSKKSPNRRGGATVPPPIPEPSGPPSVPMAARGGMGGPPPNPAQSGGPPPPVPGGGGGGGPGAAPPPNPMMGGGGPPPPNPMHQQAHQQYEQAPQQQRPLSGAERAALSAQQAEQSSASSNAQQAEAARNRPPSKRMNLMAGISAGVNLKKATVVKRKPKMEKRDMLLSALRKKGQTGLKKVAEAEKNVKVEEKQDATIFAILNRRQFIADDSDSETGSSWDSDES